MIDIMGGAGLTGQQSGSEQNTNQWQTVSRDNEASNNKTLSTSTTGKKIIKLKETICLVKLT